MVATRIEGGSGLTERIAGQNSKIWPPLDTDATLQMCAEIMSQIRLELMPPSSTAGICLYRMCERSDFPSATLDFCQTYEAGATPGKWDRDTLEPHAGSTFY
jgi:hypothetical protein